MNPTRAPQATKNSNDLFGDIPEILTEQKVLFEQLKAYLIGRDPIAALACRGEQIHDKRLLGFEISFPSIKTLNDEIFRGDHELTNRFMAHVIDLMKVQMSNSMDFVHTYVKGGFALVDNGEEEARDQMLIQFEAKVTQVFIDFLNQLKNGSSDEDEQSHYQGMLSKYGQQQIRFVYGLPEWTNEDLLLPKIAQTLGLCTAMMKWAGARNEGDTMEEEREHTRATIYTNNDVFISSLKKGLKNSFSNAFHIYDDAFKNNNRIQLKAFAVDEAEGASFLILLNNAAFTALRNGDFNNQILSGFNDKEKHLLNEYRKAVNSFDFITPYTRANQAGYFNGVLRLIELINSNDIHELQKLAAISTRDPLLHEQNGTVNAIEAHCLLTREYLTRVFTTIDLVRHTQLLFLDLIKLGYLNHQVLAGIVGIMLDEPGPSNEDIYQLLMCPLSVANAILIKLMEEIKEKLLLAYNGILTEDGGDELVIFLRQPGSVLNEDLDRHQAIQKLRAHAVRAAVLIVLREREPQAREQYLEQLRRNAQAALAKIKELPCNDNVMADCL